MKSWPLFPESFTLRIQRISKPLFFTWCEKQRLLKRLSINSLPFLAAQCFPIDPQHDGYNLLFHQVYTAGTWDIWDIRKIFFTVRVMRQWKRFPTVAVDTPSLKCSRPLWMVLWATWSNERCPYPQQGSCIFKVPSSLNHLIFLALCRQILVGHIGLD